MSRTLGQMEAVPTTRLSPFILSHIWTNWLQSSSHSQTFQLLWRWNLSSVILLASAPQREQHDFRTEQLSLSASNSIWPIVSIYIPCPNPSPAFPMMPQQMPDTEVESEQLFPLLHCCIILRNLLAFLLPSPTWKKKKETFFPSDVCLLGGLSASRFSILSGPRISWEGPGYCLRQGSRWRALGPRGRGPAARSRWWGPEAGARAAGARPPSLPGPVYSPERCKSVSSSRRLHLFLHLLRLLVWQRSPEAEF